MNERAVIDEILAEQRLLVVGVSRNEKRFSRMLFREFLKVGYDAVPVNPAVEELDGRRAYPSPTAVTPRPAAALIMSKDDRIAEAVQDCLDAGIHRLWVWRKADLELPEGAKAVTGICPLMFLPGAAWIHRFHGFLLKLGGRYPR